MVTPRNALPLQSFNPKIEVEKTRDVVYTFIEITHLTAYIKMLLIFMRLQLAVPIDYHS